MKRKSLKKEVTLHSMTNLIENLAASTARGFEKMSEKMDERFTRVDDRLNRHDKDFAELKENVKSTRQAVLDVGDRFVPRYEFDNLLIRFNKLDQKVRGKK